MKYTNIQVNEEKIRELAKSTKKLSLVKRLSMNIEDLVQYHCTLRKIDFVNEKEMTGIDVRKKIYGLIKLILKTDQVLSKEKIVVLKDLHTPTAKPTIFACTHIGGNEIQRAFQVINQPAYLMLGDPGILYKKAIYKGLELNGVIPLETTDKDDRKIAYSRAIELIKKGGNLLIYPEGAWNVSPNLLVMKIFTGTVRMAQETGVEIVPIACEQYGDTFYFSVGENYSIPKDSEKTAQELTDELRDKLTTLKWDILESQPMLKRKDVPDDYLDTFQKEIVDRCNYGYGFSLQDALNESFHDKNITTEVEVNSFMEDLELNHNNAFLAKEKERYTKIKKIRKTVI